jgi:hypothetical protein
MPLSRALACTESGPGFWSTWLNASGASSLLAASRASSR